MTITPKPLLATAYMRQAELNPLADTADLLDAVARMYHCKANALADTIDLLELTAAELCISVEAVELALEQQEAQAA